LREKTKKKVIIRGFSKKIFDSHKNINKKPLLKKGLGKGFEGLEG